MSHKRLASFNRLAMRVVAPVLVFAAFSAPLPYSGSPRAGGHPPSKTRISPPATASAPQSKASIASQSKACATCGGPASEQVLYIPLTDLPEAESGEIVFTSGSPNAMDVTPTFYLVDSSAVAGEPVRVEAAQTMFVDIKKLLPPAYKSRHDWGGLAIRYQGITREMSAQFRFDGINGGGSVDEFFVVADEPRSDIQQAV